jgi:hypothetical protein
MCRAGLKEVSELGVFHNQETRITWGMVVIDLECVALGFNFNIPTNPFDDHLDSKTGSAGVHRIVTETAKKRINVRIVLVKLLERLYNVRFYFLKNLVRKRVSHFWFLSFFPSAPDMLRRLLPPS